MSKHGLILDNEIMARDVEVLNVDYVAEFDVDGGNFIEVNKKASATDERATATKISANTEADAIAISYNPLKAETVLANGMAVRNLSVDPRNYANNAGETGCAFYPQKRDVVTFTSDALDTTEALGVEKYIVEDNGKLKGKVVATLGENPTYRKVFKILSIKASVGLFPCEKGKIGFSKQDVARAVCVK